MFVKNISYHLALSWEPGVVVLDAEREQLSGVFAAALQHLSARATPPRLAALLEALLLLARLPLKTEMQRLFMARVEQPSDL